MVIETILVSLSMAIDAMCVGASDGMSNPHLKKYKYFLIAILFGLFQFLMPVIAYFIGSTFESYINQYVPYIAFSLLSILGLKMIIETIIDLYKDKKVNLDNATINENSKSISNKKELGIITILIQAIAVSIDALTIGFVYINKDIKTAMLIFTSIGVTTFLLTLLTTFLGKLVGPKLEKITPFIGGVVLISIGCKILIEHFI